MVKILEGSRKLRCYPRKPYKRFINLAVNIMCSNKNRLLTDSLTLISSHLVSGTFNFYAFYDFDIFLYAFKTFSFYSINVISIPDDGNIVVVKRALSFQRAF